jgi:hypothetical protein
MRLNLADYHGCPNPTTLEPFAYLLKRHAQIACMLFSILPANAARFWLHRDLPMHGHVATLERAHGLARLLEELFQALLGMNFGFEVYFQMERGGLFGAMDRP